MPGTRPAPSLRAKATGSIADRVPIEVPIQVEMMALITKMPGMSIELGMKEMPRLTMDSLPPMAAPALAKPPASRTTRPSCITPGRPAPSE